jgi:hypothetical protein
MTSNKIDHERASEPCTYSFKENHRRLMRFVELLHLDFPASFFFSSLTACFAALGSNFLTVTNDSYGSSSDSHHRGIVTTICVIDSITKELIMSLGSIRR